MAQDEPLRPHRPVRLRGLFVGLFAGGPPERRPSRGAHGQAHIFPGEKTAFPLPENAPGGTDRGDDHGPAGAPGQRRRGPSPAIPRLAGPSLGLLRCERLSLLAVLRCPVSDDGGEEGGDLSRNPGPCRRPPPGRHAGGPGHGEPQRGAGDQGRRGDRGGEHLRRGGGPPPLDGPLGRGGRPLLQGHQHHGFHGGLQEREISAFRPGRRQAGRRGELRPRPAVGPGYDRGGLSPEAGRQGRLARLAAGSAESCEPQLRPDRVRLRRGVGGAARGRRQLFRPALQKAHHRRPSPPHRTG